MLELLGHLTKNWPTVGLVATLLIGVYLLARYWASAEMRDMRRRVDYLDKQVKALRYRDQIYFEYVLYDDGYHQRQGLWLSAQGLVPERHVTFLEFRDKRMRELNIEEGDEAIWEL